MIDIESNVFNYVANALRASYSGISVYGEEVEAPSSFPSVCLIERSNFEINENVTLSRSPETACRLMYQADIYSNLKSGKKAQAKAIFKIVDDKMHELGFVRTLGDQLLNIYDRTIYRITARYEGTAQTF